MSIKKEQVIGLVIGLVMLAAGFAGGIYYMAIKGRTESFQMLQLQIEANQELIDYVLEKDLATDETIDEIRMIIRDLETWIEREQEEQDLLLKKYSQDQIDEVEEILNSRVSGLWTRIFDIESDIRCLRDANCTIEPDYYCDRCGQYIGP